MIRTKKTKKYTDVVIFETPLSKLTLAISNFFDAKEVHISHNLIRMDLIGCHF